MRLQVQRLPLRVRPKRRLLLKVLASSLGALRVNADGVVKMDVDGELHPSAPRVGRRQDETVLTGPTESQRSEDLREENIPKKENRECT